MKSFIMPFNQITTDDLLRVVPKIASLGEMISSLSPLGIGIPDGFAITIDAFYDFLAFNTTPPQVQGSLERVENLSPSLRNILCMRSLPIKV